jgi:hypothetical protein
MWSLNESTGRRRAHKGRNRGHLLNPTSRIHPKGKAPRKWLTSKNKEVIFETSSIGYSTICKSAWRK